MVKKRKEYRYIYVLQQYFNGRWYDVLVRPKDPHAKGELLWTKSRMTGMSRIIVRRIRSEPS